MPRIGLGLWPRQHQTVSGGEPPAEDYSPPLTATLYDRTGTAPLLLGLVPSSRNGSTWDDVSGNGRHVTLTGSPATDDTGPMGAIRFDGSNDRGDWSGTAFADTDLTVFLVLKVQAWPSAGTYAGILELSDTTGSDRSHWLHLYGANSLTFRTGDSSGAIAYATGTGGVGSTSWMVVRMSITADARSLWVNGVYAGSSGMTKAARNVTKLRLAQRLASDVGYGNYSAAAVLIYGGRLADDASISIEDDLLTALSIATPWDFADIPLASDDSGPPRFSTFIGDVPCTTGIPVRIERLSLMGYDGRADLDLLEIPSTATEQTSHIMLVPSAGPNDFTFSKNDEPWITSFAGYSPPSVGKRYVLAFGNSNIHRMQSGLLEFIYRRLGSSLIEFVGTVAAPSGFHTPAEGRDSWVLSSTALALNAQGAFNAAGSPFFAGGASLNLAGYSALLTHAPTHVIMSCLQNAAYLASEAQLEAVLAAEKTAAIAIFDAMVAQWPSIKIGIMTEWPLLQNPNRGWGSDAQAALYRRKMHRAMEVATELALAVSSRPGVASASIISTYAHLNVGERAYDAWEDTVHMAPWGHQDLLSTTLGWFAGNW